MKESLPNGGTGAGSPAIHEATPDRSLAEIQEPVGAGLHTDAESGVAFQPFEETIICPGCNRPLQMILQPVHASIQIRCPRCVRQLTPLIRRAIREHRKRAG